MEKIKIMLSHKMSGMSDEYCYAVRDAAKKHIENNLNGIVDTNITETEIEYIENYIYPEAPENAPNLWYLGRSIQELGKCDFVFFCNDYQFSRGGVVEYIIAHLYSIPILNHVIGNMPEEIMDKERGIHICNQGEGTWKKKIFAILGIKDFSKF